MKMPQSWRAGVAAVLCASTFVAQPAYATEANAPAAATPSNESQAMDVCLSDNGTLSGQLVNGSGVPTANAAVAVFYGDQKVAEARTGEDGIFTITQLRGGVHHLVSGQRSTSCRLWASNTAPPSAGDGVLLVEGDVVRGNTCCNPYREVDPAGLGCRCYKRPLVRILQNPIVFSTLVATAIAVPIAIGTSNPGSGS